MSVFNKPEPPKFLRVLLIGSWASGKSHIMHTFPGLAVIDTQHGESSHFLDRVKKGEFPEFVSAQATTFEQGREIVKAVVAGKAGRLETLGIDSLTPMHNELVDRFTTTTQYGNPRVDWASIKAIERPFGDLLRCVPLNVVATAEPRDVRAKAGEKVDGKTVGDRDVVVAKESARYDDSIGHKFDYVFKMKREGSDSIATCLKAKDETKIKRGQEIRNLTYQRLLLMLGMVSDTGAKPAEPRSSAPPAARPQQQQQAMITAEQIDEILDLQHGLKLSDKQLGDVVHEVTRRTPMYQHITAAEASRVVTALQGRIQSKGAA